jgi:hypothetical protein
MKVTETSVPSLIPKHDAPQIARRPSPAKLRADNPFFPADEIEAKATVDEVQEAVDTIPVSLRDLIQLISGKNEPDEKDKEDEGRDETGTLVSSSSAPTAPTVAP